MSGFTFLYNCISDLAAIITAEAEILNMAILGEVVGQSFQGTFLLKHSHQTFTYVHMLYMYLIKI